MPLAARFTGQIARFTRDVNFETRTMETEIDVENQDLSISPGMYANTEMQLARASNVTTIPVEALVLKGNQQSVYVLDSSNRVHIRNVEVGLEGSKLAEIKSGLEPGDRVVRGRPGELHRRRTGLPDPHSNAVLRCDARVGRRDRL